MTDEALTRRQQQLLAKAPADWESLPSGVGSTNTTLVALERRGLVETQIEPSKRLQLSWLEGWQWRKKPSPGRIEMKAAAERPMYLEYDKPVGRPRRYCCYKDSPCSTHAAAFRALVKVAVDAAGDYKEKLEALHSHAANVRAKRADTALPTPE